MMTAREIKEYKKTLVLSLHAKERLKRGLPHLHGFPFYKWSREFFECTEKNMFLVAGNQLSKSSSLIRKAIHWATETELWPKLWPTPPKQFWYLYPDKNVATVEFKNKWVKEFLPRDEFKKEDPKYGWKAVWLSGRIDSIEFNSGVTIYFKSYAQDEMALQTSTVHLIACDEELPWFLYDELSKRRSAASVRGHFAMVFTATLSQEFWRATMEEKGKYERFPDAWKRQVSMYDCMVYEDGTPSPWTKEIIAQEVAMCSSEAEVQRRIHGRFVADEDKVFEAFSRVKNMKPNHPLPESWLIYTGVDLGSGGKRNHPAAVVFVGVKPDFTEGRVFLGWRGDGIETTAGDVLNQYRLMRKNMKPVLQCYDWESKDFHTIATRLGETFVAADKSKQIGEGMLNTLFKHQMLYIYEDEELYKLVHELENLKRKTLKMSAVDDFSDALRYAISRIPWDFSMIDTTGSEAKIKSNDDLITNPRERFYKGLDKPQNNIDLIEAEFDEVNEAYDYYGYD